MGSNALGVVSLKEEIRTLTTQRENHIKTLGEGSHPSVKVRSSGKKKQVLSTLWFWTSSLQNCERTAFCCLSHPALGFFSFFFSLLHQVQDRIGKPCKYRSVNRLICVYQSKFIWLFFFSSQSQLLFLGNKALVYTTIPSLSLKVIDILLIP